MPNESASAEPIWVTSRDGTRLGLHHFGGSGSPLLIAHATGFHARCYAPLVPNLARHFEVWGVDLRGHGASRLAPGTVFTWADFADDLLAAVDHIGGPVHAFGHSMGGATILRAATMAPAAITAAWLFEPIIFPDGIEANRNRDMAERAARRRAVFGSRAEALQRYASRPPLGWLRADALWNYVEHGTVSVDGDASTVELACRPQHEALTFDGADTPLRDVVGVEVPLVIARGRSEPGVPSAADFSDPLAAALPNARLVRYDSLSHFGPLEVPDAIATDAAGFLAGLS